MAHFDHKGFITSLTTASAIAPRTLVKIDTVSDQVVGIATVGAEPLGVVDASALAGEKVTVYGEGNIVRVTAVASLGAGADVGVASANGRLGPIAASSGVTKFRLGKALEAAADGDTFSVYVSPRQLSNLA